MPLERREHDDIHFRCSREGQDKIAKTHDKTSTRTENISRPFRSMIIRIGRTFWPLK